MLAQPQTTLGAGPLWKLSRVSWAWSGIFVGREILKQLNLACWRWPKYFDYEGHLVTSILANFSLKYSPHY